MSKNRWSILAVAISLGFALAAVGQDRGNQQGARNQTFTERYGQQLNLTDTQKKQIDDLDAKFQKDNSAFLDTYQKTMSEYREARQANDSVKIEALRPKVDSQRSEMMKLRGAQEEKIAATFTDDQKTQWKKIKDERDARMKQQRGQ
jgi:Spy/CpxP family protein refolding chaperone